MLKFNALGCYLQSIETMTALLHRNELNFPLKSTVVQSSE